ncbi:MAG: hypothetical protein ACRD2B_04940 [Terriglobia bacterium]
MKKKKNKHAALDRQLGALFGDPTSSDASELESICEEIDSDSDLVQMAYDLARRAAQQYRLAGKAVPLHVEAALTQMKESNTLEGASSSKLGEVVDAALKPFRGPTEKLAFNYHRLTDKSEKDERLLEELGDEVKRDWSEEEDSERR